MNIEAPRYNLRLASARRSGLIAPLIIALGTELPLQAGRSGNGTGVRLQSPRPVGEVPAARTQL